MDVVLFRSKNKEFDHFAAEHKSMDFDPTNSLKRCNSTPIISHILPPINKATVATTGTTNTMNLSTNNTAITSTTSRSR